MNRFGHSKAEEVYIRHVAHKIVVYQKIKALEKICTVFLQ